MLSELTATPSPSMASTALTPSLSRARRRGVSVLAVRGLVFGTPLLRAEQRPSRVVEELEPLVRLWAVAHDVVVEAAASLPSMSTSTRAALAAAGAVVWGSRHSGDARLLSSSGTILQASTTTTKQERALLALQSELARRRYLLGNPLVGLTLHRALVAADARALVLCALDIVAGASVDDDVVAQVQDGLARERLALTAAIAGLSEWREVLDVDVVRQASVWQVEHLGLPAEETAVLLEVIERPPDLTALVALVPDGAQGRVFLQVALAAVVDGRVGAAELTHLRSLGDALGIPARVQARTRRRVAAFVQGHRDALNPLADAAAFAAVDPPWAVRVARAVSENADALWTEIRETGDLGVLLARRASGQTLSDDEQRRMREQLVDVVKAVPALAMFALPGGFVLLPLLLKFLPFDLRTSAFRNRDDFRAFARDDDDSLTPEDRAAREQRLLSPAPRWRP
jgi:hypothetical protein